MDLDLTGKVALVSGSTRGLGFASAAGLAQMGAEVIINGRGDAAVTEAMAKIRQSSPSAKLHGAVFDLASAEGCAKSGELLLSSSAQATGSKRSARRLKAGTARASSASA